ncbi:putative exosome-associated protein 2, putative,3 exoribonuclease [Trypanosoma theileri]|uniref:Ribosomal RNA-processing protein 43 n=1 Tax=Trypanosoma theileri TaxID=67003 RepID=A0A1X0NRW1_9TRYP|nr:putative exosome-associated protein 2, putative,3 exoribonuclease [Trypanosoma theileri]ORC87445.1 putative exosome-associated protein 2, putative,3 exoribonuclease [Trypanosoma theileri]
MSLPPATGAVELVSFNQHVAQLLRQKKRLDERSFNSIRKPQILQDIMGEMRTDGVLASTLYTDNTGTCVNCTVSGVFGPPPMEYPDEGRLTVDVTAPFFSNQNTIKIEGALRELARFVRSTIISCMDLSELSVISGEACWVLQVDLVLLNADGGLRAATLHAAVAALNNLTLPKARLPNGDVVESKHLQFHRIPVATTIGMFLANGELQLLMDTNAAEEGVVDGLFTVVLDESDGIVAFVHHGMYAVNPSLLTGVINAFTSHSKALRLAIVKSNASTGCCGNEESSLKNE